MEGCNRQSHCRASQIEVPKPKDLTELCSHLHKAFATDRVDVDYVHALMSAYQSNPKDWGKFAKFDEYR